MLFRRSNHNRLFSTTKISSFFENKREHIRTIIENETDQYILNANEAEYINYILEKYQTEAPQIDFDQAFIDTYTADIPSEYFPEIFSRGNNEVYKGEIVQYYIPVSGESNVLLYRPSKFSIGGTHNFRVDGNKIFTEVINFSNDPLKIKSKLDSEVRAMSSNYNYLLSEFTDYESKMFSYIKGEILNRKEKILSKNQFLASIGIPIRKKNDVSSTYTIPRPNIREKVVIKPAQVENAFIPEPTLDLKMYQEFLKIINDVGKNFERMPSIYKDKGEEDLRDFILFNLDPNFQMGSASGETFNKTGKTDIQLRYDSSVVFIAECKFWSGPKNYLSTIDQLFSYLTWRDSKVAIILFVKQKEITAVIEKIKNETPNHPNHISFVSKTDENWFNYRFYLSGDANREVAVAILIFHLP